MESIGDKIRKLRKERKDTLQSLSKKINYDWSNLSKVERGTYGASVELLKSIMEVYEVEPQYFFGDGFTDAEGDLLMEDNLDTSALKKKYNLQVDGLPASEEEVKEAIRLIRYLRTRED